MDTSENADDATLVTGGGARPPAALSRGMLVPRDVIVDRLGGRSGIVADRSMRRPLRALVLVDAVLVAALTHDPRERALRAELEPLLEGLGDRALWHRDDLSRWSDPGGVSTP